MRSGSRSVWCSASSLPGVGAPARLRARLLQPQRPYLPHYQQYRPLHLRPRRLWSHQHPNQRPSPHRGGPRTRVLPFITPFNIQQTGSHQEISTFGTTTLSSIRGPSSHRCSKLRCSHWIIHHNFPPCSSIRKINKGWMSPLALTRPLMQPQWGGTTRSKQYAHPRARTGITSQMARRCCISINSTRPMGSLHLSLPR